MYWHVLLLEKALILEKISRFEGFNLLLFMSQRVSNVTPGFNLQRLRRLKKPKRPRSKGGAVECLDSGMFWQKKQQNHACISQRLDNRLCVFVFFGWWWWWWWRIMFRWGVGVLGGGRGVIDVRCYLHRKMMFFGGWCLCFDGVGGGVGGWEGFFIDVRCYLHRKKMFFGGWCLCFDGGRWGGGGVTFVVDCHDRWCWWDIMMFCCLSSVKIAHQRPLFRNFFNNRHEFHFQPPRSGFLFLFAAQGSWTVARK